MTIDVNLAVVALLISAGALLAAWATYARAGDWRQTDAGKETAAKLTAHAERLTKLETRLENLATKADVERVEGKVNTLEAHVEGIQDKLSNVGAGVERIEQFLMDASQP